MKPKLLICLVLPFLPINQSIGQVGIVDQHSENKPAIVFIGTYHMGKQGNNVYKGNYDDVLQPERQQELTLLLEKLKSFKPTKIVVERDITHSELVQNRYTNYLNDQFKLTRNEVHQIGFKLAKELKHTKIYSVDWGIFPEDKLYNYETYANNNPDLKSYLVETRANDRAYFEKENKILNELTILQQLRKLNSKENIENGHKGYFNIMRIGLDDEYVGANYLSWWYGRNMKILVNIISLTESSDDRILVIYGAGHLKLLTQLTTESRFYDVVDPLEVLGD